MNDDLSSQNEKSLDDLLRQSQGQVKVSSEEVEEKLKSKIKELEEKKIEEAVKAKAEAAGFNHVFLKRFPVSAEALSLVPESEARRLRAACFLKTETELRLAAIEPANDEVQALLAKLSAETRTHGEIYQVSEQSLAAVLKLYEALPKPRKYVAGIELSAEDLGRFQAEIGSFRELAEKIQHVSTTDLFAMITAGAIKANASDIHIEAEQADIKVRFRIDGVLYDVALLDKKLWPQVINRVKLLAKLKINVTDIPQDGRFTIYLAKEFIDVRVASVPSAYGESVVMRLLMSSATSLELESLGMVGDSFDVMKKEIGRPNGMILSTGPTGSGKTTTLYAILKKLNKPESKIITLENPIEYRVKGITQSQVETSEQAEGEKVSLKKMLQSGSEGRRHFTYASGLRAVLRQDPDIVMVGEIRDVETAEISIQAALTGHLMLSTLHTNSAAGAIPRLLSMQVKPYLLAPALNVIIGQRLVRKICQDCQEEYTPSGEILDKLKEVISSMPENKRPGLNLDNLKLRRGQGCAKCSQIGYKGRIGIFEVLTMNEEIEKLVLTGQVSEYQIQDIAKKHGMVTMLQDGILKVLQGLTTPEEIFRATD